MSTRSQHCLSWTATALLLLAAAGCGGPAAQSPPETSGGPAGTEMQPEPSEPAPGDKEIAIDESSPPEPPLHDELEPADVPPTTGEAASAPDPVVDTFLPPWWHDEPCVRAGRLYACAVAEATSLSAANSAAVATGLNAMRAALLERGVGNVESLLADSRTETAAADLAGPNLWRGFVEISVAYVGDR